MPNKENADIYQELGIRKVVNAVGTATVMGGAVLSPRVQTAMDQAGQSFASMEEVVTRAGEAIASDLGAEAAFVTSGCFAALAISCAAVMTGPDTDLIAQLPDTTGLRDQFLIQNRHRYHYDRSVSVPGGKLVEVGDENGVTRSQFEEAIGPDTAGALYPAHMDGMEGTLSLAEVISISEARGIAVVVDAAFQVYPCPAHEGHSQMWRRLHLLQCQVHGRPQLRRLHDRQETLSRIRPTPRLHRIRIGGQPGLRARLQGR